MKTRRINTVKGILAGMLVILAIASSCSNGKTNKEDGVHKEVEVPEMDLLTAVVMGDIKAVKQHIAAGSDLNIQDPDQGSTALITAAVFDRTEIARALAEAGADVNVTNKDGATALHTAAFLCRTEIVQILLDHGADKSIRNVYGSTALESIVPPFEAVKPIYDQFSKDLGPFGFRLDYGEVKEMRPVIAEMLQE